jgi:hypothetical protein
MKLHLLTNLAFFFMNNKEHYLNLYPLILYHHTSFHCRVTRKHEFRYPFYKITETILEEKCCRTYGIRNGNYSPLHPNSMLLLPLSSSHPYEYTTLIDGGGGRYGEENPILSLFKILCKNHSYFQQVNWLLVKKKRREFREIIYWPLRPQIPHGLTCKL